MSDFRGSNSSSNLIKSSSITGEYQLSEKETRERYEEEKSRKNDENRQQDEKNEKSEEAEKALEQARSEADDILEEARQKADEIIAAAENEAEKIKEQAEEEGYKEGYDKGLAEGREEARENLRKEHQKSLQTVTEAAARTDERLEKEVRDTSERIVDFAVDIAEKIVQTEIHFNPEVIVPIVEECLEEISLNNNEITIRVAPEVEEYLRDLDYEGRRDTEIKIVADSGLKPGDCLVETDFGGQDATIESKLEILRDQLTDEVKNTVEQ
ncbi:FliH/SctL family protein [Halarsenatibacter silvermanii]|uniref:Flagellar assembly protein FliH n=1 Tax=Halarsenatibacter silvermanii TaxID=321763 RepID=A0A1G9MI37_9FIRM|nr:FliH/SctL family protein [Halarsenatibacter silvermanii]SDL73567.1 flagellar assembly protein FliH [Halarsenatibacter silvermanii]